jgi:branched-chain amino acid transport system permease protein
MTSRPRASEEGEKLVDQATETPTQAPHRSVMATSFSLAFPRRLLSRRSLELVALIGGLGIPFLLSDAYNLRILTLSWLFATAGVGLVVSLGYTGIFNISQGTFFGIGAYATAILVTKYRLSLEIAIVVSLAFTALVGGVVSLTALRIRGDYWAVVSMAFTVGAEKVFENWRPVTQGLDGYVGIPELSIFSIQINSPRAYYYASFGALALAFLLTRSLVHSFAGRAMLAIRFDEAGARAMGISVYYYKVLSMVWSAAVAGLAGSFLVAVAGYIYPTDFDLLSSFNITLFVIVGGIKSPWGAILATTFLVSVTEIYRPITDYRFLILGGAVLFAIFLRGGVFDPVLAPLRTLAVQALKTVRVLRAT